MNYIAYFCAEYALNQKIPTYAGGLGVLAGDLVREAADQKYPLLAVCLYYHEGYVCASENMSNKFIRTSPKDIGLKPVYINNGKRLKISVPIQDHDVVVQVWEFKQGDNSVYFMDSDIEDNTVTDRRITDRLYVGDNELRLKQEIILGIGGFRLLVALNIKPVFYHLNEGHSAMLVFELIRYEMNQRKIGFEDVLQFVREQVVFTNHTLIMAGNEVYSYDLVSLLLSKFAQQIKVPIFELIKLGLIHESRMFSMTMFLLGMAGTTSAVSKLHAKKALDIWPDYQMLPITNGIHRKSWDMVEKDLSKSGSLWVSHQKRKKELLKYINENSGVEWGKDDLVIGWARRFVTYKRPLAILDDLDKFKRIAQNSVNPVRLVIAGISHFDDKEGLAMLEKLSLLIDGELAGMVVYLPEYNMNLAKLLISGCDVWLNTPIVGFEACGTSGMKAALNGVLLFSTADGWVDEINLSEVGWLINSDQVTASILKVLEHKIIPIYLDRDKLGLPKKWEKLMRNSREMIINHYCTSRMLEEYQDKLYKKKMI